jgi:hypothetical protein
MVAADRAAADGRPKKKGVAGMSDTSNHVSGILALALGVWAIAKRQVGFGVVNPKPQFTINGPLAVLIGVALLGIGAFLLLSA